MVVLGSGQCYEPYLSQQPHNGSQFPLGNCGILTLALITAGAGEGVVECSGWLWASLKELTAVVIPSELVACVHLVAVVVPLGVRLTLCGLEERGEGERGDKEVV